MTTIFIAYASAMAGAGAGFSIHFFCNRAEYRGGSRVVVTIFLAAMMPFLLGLALGTLALAEIDRQSKGQGNEK